MRPGDLVRFTLTALPNSGGRKRVGIIIKIIDKFHRDDNVVVQWDAGKIWCVAPHWIEVINENSKS